MWCNVAVQIGSSLFIFLLISLWNETEQRAPWEWHWTPRFSRTPNREYWADWSHNPRNQIHVEFNLEQEGLEDVPEPLCCDLCKGWSIWLRTNFCWFQIESCAIEWGDYAMAQLIDSRQQKLVHDQMRQSMTKCATLYPAPCTMRHLWST